MLLLGLILWFLPRIISTPLRIVLESLMYATALYDTYCLQHFGKGISPTMLSFLINTDSREIIDFLHSYGLQILTDWRTDILLLLIIVHVSFSFKVEKLKSLLLPHRQQWLLPICSVCILVSLVVSWPVRERLFILLSQQNLTDMEGLVFRHYHYSAYTPPLRLLYAQKTLLLTENEIRRLEESTLNAQPDSCSYRSKHIVLIQ
jgi:heptose-I-phosphate ethanolaminephosphotransferase